MKHWRTGLFVILLLGVLLGAAAGSCWIVLHLDFAVIKRGCYSIAILAIFIYAALALRALGQLLRARARRLDLDPE